MYIWNDIRLQVNKILIIFHKWESTMQILSLRMKAQIFLNYFYDAV